ncbi:MAG TPA: 30S ribosome-binding factor RbfA [Desulfobacteraceae bacterium]|nr:30S ribosome-binding factor RbfA [Desulfobacteraceae bacterium]
MYHRRRAIRLGDQILREMSLLLVHKVRDPRVRGVTLTGISLSSDLRKAKVYYSLIGDEKAIKRAQEGLDRAKGFIKREVALRVSLKYMPDIIFRYDPSLAMGDKIDRVFREIKKGEKSDI